MRCHFDSELARNWSTTTCAPLMKSPNCASQRTSRRGSARLMPSSKPSTAFSDSMLSMTRNGAWSPRMLSSGTYRSPVSTSWRTAWRWLKVPRHVSCPLMRTGMPSSSSAPRASASAQLQSMPRPRLDQLLAVERERRPLGRDLLVHHRLREGRIVELVVPVPAVADEVDEDVFLEALAKADGQAGRLHRGLGVVAVHVEDGRLDDLGDVARVGGEAVRLGRRREADLVVDDDVHRAAGAVAVELREPEGLGHHPLAGEGRVAVHEDGHDARVLGVVQVLLLGAHHALDDRIDRLQVARVGGQREVDLPPRARGVVARVAEVVLDVAVAGRLLGEQAALELRDDHLVGLAEHVGEHVDPPAVRHAEDHLLDAEAPRVLDQRVEEGNERVTALEREALGGRIPELEELLEALRDDQAVEDAQPVLGGEVGMGGGRLHALREPDALLLVLDVHVLDAERAAVGRLEARDQVADAGARAAAEAAARDDAVEVLVAEAEL